VPLAVMVLALVGHPLLARPYRFGFSHLLGLALFGAGFRFLKRPPRWLLWLGAVSYPVYLLNAAVISLFLFFLESGRGERAWGAPLGVYMGAALGLCLMLAAAVHYGVEKPALALGKRLSRPPRRGPF